MYGKLVLKYRFSVFLKYWFVNAMVYFGASYGASDFDGNMYFNFALTSLVEIPAAVLAIDNCERYIYIRQ